MMYHIIATNVKKKRYTKRDKHKCPSKCLSCFTFIKSKKCEGKEIIYEKCNRKSYGEQCFKNHLKNRSKEENKSDTVCLKCERIITGKYVNIHKCGYRERTNCVKYVDKDHKCYLKTIKVKGGYCTVNKNNPCKISKSVKKKDWCFSRRSYTEKYLFYDFECTQDYNGNGNEYIHKNVD